MEALFCLTDWFYPQFSIQVLTGIANCLHFVDIIVINDVIKCGVELVEEIYNLVRSTGTRQLSEANNVTVIEELHEVSPEFVHQKIQSKGLSKGLALPEVDGGVREALSLCCSALTKVIRHWFW